MFSRRALLVTGGASILVLGGSYAGLSAMSNIAPAQEPWRRATQGLGDPRLNAAAYAILAPSPHNLQPWMIRLEGDDSMTLFCDLDRRLPETDPPDRQTTIGLGAFLELLRQAAAEQGHRLDITPFPEGEPGARLDARPIAHVHFVEDAGVERDALFGHALKRRTARRKFDPGRPVPSDRLAALMDISNALPGLDAIKVDGTSQPETVSWLRDICRRAWEIELRKPETCHESSYLTRIGAKQINANPDGIYLAGPMMEAYRMTGLLTQDSMDEIGSTTWEATLSTYNGLIDSAPTFLWFTTPGNSRAEQLASGAVWIRLQLAAAAVGVGFQPLSQVLEEYSEMAEPFAEIHDRFNVTLPGRIQGLFRLGYAGGQSPSPRWPLESRIIT
ncbi:Acg family FMN-binding oxidoreductase [Hyphomonas jannaschiana]|uniref:Acg family FMN-binding oxidoreductase n=1 Tax=Hyphomonas jannaschiana TaxID=86 RepID=UPI0035C70733